MGHNHKRNWVFVLVGSDFLTKTEKNLSKIPSMKFNENPLCRKWRCSMGTNGHTKGYRNFFSPPLLLANGPNNVLCLRSAPWRGSERWKQSCTNTKPHKQMEVGGEFYIPAVLCLVIQCTSVHKGWWSHRGRFGQGCGAKSTCPSSS